jgi:hypothetical protein
MGVLKNVDTIVDTSSPPPARPVVSLGQHAAPSN